MRGHFRGHDRRVDGRDDLRLQPRLLVQADLQVGEQDPGGLRARIRFQALPLIMRERFAEVVLTVGRRTGTQACGECEKCQ